MTDCTEMEIYQDGVDARAACENIEINSGDRDDLTSST